MLGEVMRTSIKVPRPAGFTLVELMVVLAVIAVLLFVAAPSFRELMVAQRVRGTSDQFLTDVQFARSEAASRQEVVGITFKPPLASMSCYTIHTCGSLAPANCTCDCSAAVGSRCPAASVANPDPPREVRTVQLNPQDGVSLIPVALNGNPLPGSFTDPSHITFDPNTGSLTSYYAVGLVLVPKPPGGAFWAKTSSTNTGSTVVIRDIVNKAGRPSSCKPVGSSIGGLAAC